MGIRRPYLSLRSSFAVFPDMAACAGQYLILLQRRITRSECLRYFGTIRFQVLWNSFAKLVGILIIVFTVLLLALFTCIRPAQTWTTNKFFLFLPGPGIHRTGENLQAVFFGPILHGCGPCHIRLRSRISLLAVAFVCTDTS